MTTTPIRCFRTRARSPWHALNYKSNVIAICDRVAVGGEERRTFTDTFPPENETCRTCYRALTWVIVR